LGKKPKHIRFDAILQTRDARSMRPKFLLRVLMLVFVAVSWGCTLISTGARSAIVVLLRSEVTTAGSGSLPMPPRDEIKSALLQRTLWLADDKRAAQWIAYIEVRTPPTPLQPFGLTVVEVRKNPHWDPAAVSTPISARDIRLPTAHDLSEAGEQRERSLVSSGK
jgi:hypothetical protein